MRTLLKTGAFIAALLGATSAFAAPALVTTDLNLRTGPGAGFGRIASMPGGALVDVTGCTRGYDWCRVSWRGYDGWASSNYLAFRSGRYSGRSYSSYAATFGIPLVAGIVIGNAFNNDHRDWRDHDRRDRRREVRQERRERRRDIREERREHRREVRKERREHRQGVRQERREDRRGDRAERRREGHSGQVSRRDWRRDHN